ncbi:hypothetical protein BU15DRAFT_68674 [Melanogaster broomeanus]|nr:hypothetical protein BU15DRAFT_68674 [Melanogaster broomeanus]
MTGHAKSITKGGKLVGDGLPRLLTSDEFHSQVVEHEKVAVEEELAREEWCKQWDERKEAMGPWIEAEAARLERNREAERDLAKAEKRPTRWNQPKLGKLESCLPKPIFEIVEMDGDGDNNEGMDPDDGLASWE